ncbi:MAG: glycogen/starch synthase, partial [Candidatus Omnitrophica bacterium]|nr:glycogen/starch synthase [Candidatus Omnitrophota bacterium]
IIKNFVAKEAREEDKGKEPKFINQVAYYNQDGVVIYERDYEEFTTLLHIDPITGDMWFKVNKKGEPEPIAYRPIQLVAHLVVIEPGAITPNIQAFEFKSIYEGQLDEDGKVQIVHIFPYPRNLPKNWFLDFDDDEHPDAINQKVSYKIRELKESGDFIDHSSMKAIVTVYDSQNKELYSREYEAGDMIILDNNKAKGKIARFTIRNITNEPMVKLDIVVLVLEARQIYQEKSDLPVILRNQHDVVLGVGSLEASSSINEDKDITTLISNLGQYGAMTTGKWLLHSERLDKVYRGDFYGITPVTVQFIPSLLCDYRCPTCSYGKSKEKIRLLKSQGLLEKSSLFMSLENMKKFLSSLKESGVKGVIFTGGGEPFMNPQTINGIRYAVEKGLIVGVFTNGSLLNRRLIGEIIDAGVNFLRISLNAGTPEIHKLFHGVNTEKVFAKVLRNLELFAEAIRKKRSPLELGVGVIINPLNIDNLIEIANRVKEIDARHPGVICYISYRPTVRYVGGCQDTPVTRMALEYVRQHKVLQKYYPAYYNFLYGGYQFPRELFDEAVRILQTDVKPLLKENSIDVWVPSARMEGIWQKQKPFNECLSCPWVSFIGPDGTVYHCVELGLDERVAYGNLQKESFSQIWQGQQRKSVVDYINREGLGSICPPVCLLYEYNIVFGLLKQALMSEDLELKRLLVAKIQEISRNYSDEVVLKIKDGTLKEHFEKFLYPLAVPLDAHNEALVFYGNGDIAEVISVSKSNNYELILLKGKLYQGWDAILQNLILELLKFTRAPPSFTIIISTDVNLTRGNVAACDINSKTIFIHPYLFILQKRLQLAILYHELLSHIVKAIRDESIALKDTQLNIASVYVSVTQNCMPIGALIRAESSSRLIQRIFDFLSVRQPISQSDVMMVSGNYDLRISQEVAKFGGYADYIVTTGYKGKFTQHFNEPEAVVFKRILLENSIPEGKIIVEDKTVNTKENLDNSFAIIKEKGIKHENVLLVAHPLHTLRAQATMRRYYPNIKLSSLAAYKPSVVEMNPDELRFMLQYALRELRKIRDSFDRDWISLTSVELKDLVIAETILGFSASITKVSSPILKSDDKEVVSTKEIERRIRHIAFVTPEINPFSGTGGLGVVAYQLAKNLAKLGAKVNVFSYKYKDINSASLKDTKLTFTLKIKQDKISIKIWSSEIDGVNVFFLEDDHGISDSIYSGDQLTQSIVLCDGTFKAIETLVENKLIAQPTILHAHDWQTGLIPVFLKTKYNLHPLFADVAGAFSIHNLAYQGGDYNRFEAERFAELGIDDIHWFGLVHPSDPISFNVMRGAIYHTDIIITVAKHYAQETLLPEFGEEMDVPLKERVKDYFGVINGMDVDPRKIGKPDIRPFYKMKLQKFFGLHIDKDVPVLAMATSRITKQKNNIAAIKVVERILKETGGKVQFIMIGKGHPKDSYYHEAKKIISDLLDDPRWGGNIAVRFETSIKLSTLIVRGADILLMPSQREPCGLIQQVALAFGCIPIVRKTGGLADTVKEFDIESEAGNGFLFNDIKGDDFHYAVLRALNILRNNVLWNKIMENAQSEDRSWNKSVQEYVELYKLAVIRKLSYTKPLKASSSLNNYQVIDNKINLESVYESIWQDSGVMVAAQGAPKPLVNYSELDISLIATIPDFSHELIERLYDLASTIKGDGPFFSITPKNLIHTTLFIFTPSIIKLHQTTLFSDANNQIVKGINELLKEVGSITVNIKGINIGTNGAIFAQGRVVDEKLFELRRGFDLLCSSVERRSRPLHISLLRISDQISPEEFKRLYEIVSELREIYFGTVVIRYPKLIEVFDRWGFAQGKKIIFATSSPISFFQAWEQANKDFVSADKVIQHIRNAQQEAVQRLGIGYTIPVILFGSYAEGRQREGSDLDISVSYLGIPVASIYDRLIKAIEFKDELCKVLRERGYFVDPHHDFIIVTNKMDLIKAKYKGELGLLRRLVVIAEDKVEIINVDEEIRKIWRQDILTSLALSSSSSLNHEILKRQGFREVDIDSYHENIIVKPWLLKQSVDAMPNLPYHPSIIDPALREIGLVEKLMQLSFIDKVTSVCSGHLFEGSDSVSPGNLNFDYKYKIEGEYKETIEAFHNALVSIRLIVKGIHYPGYVSSYPTWFVLKDRNYQEAFYGMNGFYTLFGEPGLGLHYNVLQALWAEIYLIVNRFLEGSSVKQLGARMRTEGKQVSSPVINEAMDIQIKLDIVEKLRRDGFIDLDKFSKGLGISRQDLIHFIGILKPIIGEVCDVVEPINLFTTGIAKTREAIHRDGDWHRTDHILGVSEDGLRVAIQDRNDKRMSKGFFVTGHFGVGERAQLSLARETDEEIGVIDLDRGRLYRVFRFFTKIGSTNYKGKIKYKNDIFYYSGSDLLNREVSYLYLYVIDSQEEELLNKGIQSPEVKGLSFIEWDELIEDVLSNPVKYHSTAPQYFMRRDLIRILTGINFKPEHENIRRAISKIKLLHSRSNLPVAREGIKPYPASSSPLNQANPFIPLAVKRTHDNELPYKTYIRGFLTSGNKYNLNLEKGEYKSGQKSVFEEAFGKVAVPARAPPEILIVISNYPSRERELLTVWGINYKHAFQYNLPESTIFIHSYFFHDDFGSEQRANFISQALKEITEKSDTGSNPMEEFSSSPVEKEETESIKRIREIWDYIRQDIKSRDPEVAIKKIPFLSRLYHALDKTFKGIIDDVSKGRIEPFVKLNLRKYSLEMAGFPIARINREIRVGFLPIAANPLNWGHILIAFMAIKLLSLDVVVYRVQGEIRYKNFPESDRVPTKDRHQLMQEVLERMSPLLRYTDLGSEPNNQREGFEEIYRFLELNKDCNIHLYYLLGVENKDRVLNYARQQYSLQSKYSVPADHQVTVGWIQRGDYGASITFNELKGIYEEFKQATEAKEDLDVCLVKDPDIDLNVASTYYRNSHDPAIVPLAVDRHAKAQGYYGHPPIDPRTGKPYDYSEEEYFKIKLRPITEAIANQNVRMLERLGRESIVLAGIDGPSGSGKSTIAEEVEKFLELRNTKSVVIPLDIFLKEKRWRAALEKVIIDWELSNEEYKILGSAIDQVQIEGGLYYDEEIFFDQQRILVMLKAIRDFRFSDKENYQLNIPSGYYRSESTRRDFSFPLSKGMVIIVEGKYALREEFLPFYDIRYRLLDNPDRTKAKFEMRTRSLSPNTADHQMLFYDIGLIPSYEKYAQRTEEDVDKIINIVSDDWFLFDAQDAPSSSSPMMLHVDAERVPFVIEVMKVNEETPEDLLNFLPLDTPHELARENYPPKVRELIQLGVDVKAYRCVGSEDISPLDAHCPWHPYRLWVEIPLEQASFVRTYLRGFRDMTLLKLNEVENKLNRLIVTLGQRHTKFPMGAKDTGFVIFEILGLPYPPGIVLSSELLLNIYESKEISEIELEYILSRLEEAGAFNSRYPCNRIKLRSAPRVSMPGRLLTIQVDLPTTGESSRNSRDLLLKALR